MTKKIFDRASYRPGFFLDYISATKALYRVNGKYRLSGFQLSLVGLFIESMTPTHLGIDLTQKRHRSNKVWRKILGCNSDSYVSKILSDLESANVIYTVHSIGQRTYRAFHPRFLTALQEMHRAEWAEEESSEFSETRAVDNVHNHVRHVRTFVSVNDEPSYVPMTTSYMRHVRTFVCGSLYRKKETSLRNLKEETSLVGNPSENSVDNPKSNVTDLPSFTMARRFIANGQTSEPAEKVSKWFKTLIDHYGRDRADAYLHHSLGLQSRSLSLHQHSILALKFFETRAAQ